MVKAFHLSRVICLSGTSWLRFKLFTQHFSISALTLLQLAQMFQRELSPEKTVWERECSRLSSKSLTFSFNFRFERQATVNRPRLTDYIITLTFATCIFFAVHKNVISPPFKLHSCHNSARTPTLEVISSPPPPPSPLLKPSRYILVLGGVSQASSPWPLLLTQTCTHRD